MTPKIPNLDRTQEYEHLHGAGVRLEMKRVRGNGWRVVRKSIVVGDAMGIALSRPDRQFRTLEKR